ncbi:Apolipophorins, partial [Gryllus bimaculatus]
MLNLTVDLFGESINVFEVSGRLEGFEHYLESIFGPRGPLSSRKVNDKLEDALKRVRLARDVNNNLVDQVDSIPNVIDNNFNHPKASLGLKVFGNELRYHTLDGDDEVADALNKVNPVRLLQQLLSGQEINYNKATMFMDADYVVPTGGGLPLSLNAFGTAAVSLKMSGSLKGGNFLQTGELDVTGNIRPSVAVNVVGTMGVDAYYSSAGIRLKTNLYTSSAVDAQLKVRGKRLVSLAFNLPKDKIEIITAESELLVLAGAGAVELPQRGDARGRVERRFCSWPALDQTLGLNFCADLQFPNASHRADAPGFLLNGPTRFSLAFQKADLTANNVVSLVFDTPGSAQKRELSARLHLDNNTNNLTLLIQSAKVKYEALGRYKNTEGDKHILFELNINDKKHVDMELSLKTEKITNGFKYLPRLYLEINSTGIAELSGTLQLIEKKGVSQCDVNLEFKTRKLESQLTGYVKRGEATVQLYLKLNYKFQNATDETVTLDASFTHRHSKSYTRAEGEIKIISSAYPKYNFKSSLHYQ